MMITADLVLPEIPLPQLLSYLGVGLFLLLAVHVFLALLTNRHAMNHRHRGLHSVLVYIAFLLSIAILAVTSFGALIWSGHVSGFALMAHIAAAGAFVFLLLLVAFLFLPTGAMVNQPGYTADNRWWVARWSAWALVLFSLLAAGTMLLSMLPVFDTQQLLQVATIHRYSGLAVVVAAIIHGYALLCTRFGLR